MFKRDKHDDRSARQVANDVSHDLYHRVAKLTKFGSDGKTNYQHFGDCEWTRANEED